MQVIEQKTPKFMHWEQNTPKVMQKPLQFLISLAWLWGFLHERM